MAAATQVQTVNITINDVELQVPSGELIVESVKRLGLEIPIFCYHPRMKPVGMCRMCLVEVGFKQPDGSVRKMPKPQAACTLPASEGMAVYTDTEMVHNDRRGVLEFLLINHPLDCPICDRGGECPLQNNTLFYGPSTSRFVEMKRHLPKAYPLSDYVTLDLERCIQCGRCVRFTEEISGDSELAFRFRGAAMQPSTFELRKFTSKFSGNVIEICPVGALTSSRYRFRARPWDLQTRPAICTQCGNGCNIWFDYRLDKMVRINGRTNEAVNEEWTCDRGKFGHEFYNSSKRLSRPLIRRGSVLEETDWAEAYSVIIKAFQDGGNAVAALGGATTPNEGIYLLQKLFRNQFKSNNLDHRFAKFLPTAAERIDKKVGMPAIQSTIASFESEASTLVFGTSLADEEPILFLRLRKGWFNSGNKVVVAHHEPTDADSFAHVVLRYKRGTEKTLAAGLAQGIKKGAIEGLEAFTPEFVEEVTGVKRSDLHAAAEALSTSPAIITTLSLYEEDGGDEAAVTLASIAKATGGKFNQFGLYANDQGAAELGLLPDVGPSGSAISGQPGMSTHEILEGCISGSIKALWLVDCDPFLMYPDRSVVERALESVEFLVYQGSTESEATSYASVVLAQCAPAEAEGTFTNIERRVQRFRQVLAPKGEAKPAWKIFEEVTLRMSPKTPLFNAAEVMAEIAQNASDFAQIDYDSIPNEGYLLGTPFIGRAEPEPAPVTNG